MIYLLHFIPRYRHAGHYLGYTPDENVGRRVGEHMRGVSGVSLTDAAARAGVVMLLARTWPGDQNRERDLKGYRNNGRVGSLARLCPVCKADGYKRKEQKRKRGSDGTT